MLGKVIPAKGVGDLAMAHAVSSLIYDSVYACTNGHGELYDRIRKETEKTAMQSYRLLFETKIICDLLDAAGIRIAVLKGAAVSLFYPTPEYRKSGDVDIIL